MNWKRITTEATVLVIAAVLVGAGTNYIRPEARKLAWVADYRAPESGSRMPGSPNPGRESGLPTLENPATLIPPKDPGLLYLDISSEVAMRLHSAGALFIDARCSSAYEQGHIANAINIPVWEHDADGRVSALQAKGTKPDAVIVVYCSGGTCEDSAMLALKLAQAGFYNIYLYKDGFPACRAKGGRSREGSSLEQALGDTLAVAACPGFLGADLCLLRLAENRRSSRLRPNDMELSDFAGFFGECSCRRASLAGASCRPRAHLGSAS
jgi:rhodanese-related sulfurtransferase